MNWRVIKERYRTKKRKTKKQEKINILSYYPDQIEKSNFPGETELASRKALKSREIILKTVFLAECRGMRN